MSNAADNDAPPVIDDTKSAPPGEPTPGEIAAEERADRTRELPLGAIVHFKSGESVYPAMVVGTNPENDTVSLTIFHNGPSQGYRDNVKMYDGDGGEGWDVPHVPGDDPAD